MMLETLMNSMDPDKVDSLNQLDFNRPRVREERESMMINQKTGAFPNEMNPASAMVGAGAAMMGSAQPAPQALSYSQLSA